MWFLKSLKKQEVFHYLLVDEEYTIGRKDASILIVDDPSISRKHAVFHLSHPEANLNNVQKLPILMVRDAGSKYGTRLNKERQIGSEGTVLKIGDRITFGQCGSSYEVCHMPLIVSTSCVEGEEKKSSRQNVRKLGGHVVSEWPTDCTHLVMKEIKVTIKAVCAMVSLTPIVTPKYLEDLVWAIREKKNHPDVERYIPKSGEPLLAKENVSFGPNPSRMKVFENKHFICTSQKQYKKLRVGITLASGRITLLGEDDEIKASTLLHSDTVVMKHQSDSAAVPSPALPSHLETIERELKRNKKRTIPESDIGLAVVHCSTERYCNPSYNLGSNLFSLPNLPSQTFTQGDFCIEETQSMQSSGGSRTKCGSFVEESLERSHPSSEQSPARETPDSRKRIREEEIKLEPSSKHSKLLEADKFNSYETNVSVSTVPITSESEMPIDIKEEECSPVHSPWHAASPDHDEDESIEDVQTQVWEDPSKEDVPDGFITKPKKDNSIVKKPKDSDSYEDLPSRLVNVEYAALCPPRNNRPARVEAVNCSQLNGILRNFKKFRKVYSSADRLPRIIGGRDLVTYDKNSSKTLDEWLSQNPETQPQREEVGLFDWEENPRARRR